MDDWDGPNLDAFETNLPQITGNELTPVMEIRSTAASVDRRDWFAGLALVGWVARIPENGGWTEEGLARQAFETADAMIAASGGPPVPAAADDALRDLAAMVGHSVLALQRIASAPTDASRDDLAAAADKALRDLMDGIRKARESPAVDDSAGSGV